MHVYEPVVLIITVLPTGFECLCPHKTCRQTFTVAVNPECKLVLQKYNEWIKKKKGQCIHAMEHCSVGEDMSDRSHQEP